jgi:hypothetical protein
MRQCHPIITSFSVTENGQSAQAKFARSHAAPIRDVFSRSSSAALLASRLLLHWRFCNTRGAARDERYNQILREAKANKG